MARRPPPTTLLRDNAARLRELIAELETDNAATRCASCGCTRQSPRCTIVLDDEGSVAPCLHAGAFGSKVCSACMPGVRRA